MTKMFKKGSYNVKKTEKSSTEVKPSTTAKSKHGTSTKPKAATSTKTSTMTLKKKAEIKNVSNKESPDYRKKSFPKNVTSTKWVENKTFNKK